MSALSEISCRKHHHLSRGDAESTEQSNFDRKRSWSSVGISREIADNGKKRPRRKKNLAGLNILAAAAMSSERSLSSIPDQILSDPLETPYSSSYFTPNETKAAHLRSDSAAITDDEMDDEFDEETRNRCDRISSAMEVYVSGIPEKVTHRKDCCTEVNYNIISVETKFLILSYLSISELQTYSLTSKLSNEMSTSQKFWLKRLPAQWRNVANILRDPSVEVSLEDFLDVSSAVDHRHKEKLITSAPIPVRGTFHSFSTFRENNQIPKRYCISYNHEAPSTRRKNFFLLHKLSLPLPGVFSDTTEERSHKFKWHSQPASGANKDATLVRRTSLSDDSHRSSIRSDRPFPFVGRGNAFPSTSLYELMRNVAGPENSKIRSMKEVLLKTETVRPFCSPCVYQENNIGGRSRVTIDVTPRLVAYFELTCTRERLIGSTLSGANITIGLSTEGFLKSALLPGEDSKSFGFHGGNGNFYYDNNIFSRGGKSFGAGDTVGCGIDYVQRAIFFTINGQFLGYIFKNLNLTTQFFPTIGIDGCDTIRYNFGMRPFAFDLNNFCRKHSPIVKGEFLKGP